MRDGRGELEAEAWPGWRVVVPSLPHHITRRGNCREPVFFGTARQPRDHRIERAVTRRREPMRLVYHDRAEAALK